MHLVLLNDACLAKRMNYVMESLLFLHLELVYCAMCHANDHEIVAQIGLVKTDLRLIQLDSRLINLFFRNLLSSLLCYHILSLVVEHVLG